VLQDRVADPIDHSKMIHSPMLADGIDMTREEFAQRIGISQNCLSTMERGDVQIGSGILLKMSREFGKSMEGLLTIED
jgi:plasmid maintenance system antidote protein VapI